MITNFTLKEMLRTDTDLPNIPSWEELNSIQLTASFLQHIRNIYGKPITINSAYRSKEVNAKVGGSSSSYHLKGLAADIKASNMSTLLAILMRNIDQIDQLGIYTNKLGRYVWFHVGLPMSNKTPRKQIYYKEV